MVGDHVSGHQGRREGEKRLRFLVVVVGVYEERKKIWFQESWNGGALGAQRPWLDGSILSVYV